MKSFDLAQLLEGPTHLKAHTLNIVSTSGFTINSVDMRIPFDHRAIILRALFSPPAPKGFNYVSSCILITHCTDSIHRAFTATSANTNNQNPKKSTDELLNNFNSIIKQKKIARSLHFSNIIVKDYHNSRVHFTTNASSSRYACQISVGGF